jgi:hypothetical protein
VAAFSGRGTAAPCPRCRSGRGHALGPPWTSSTRRPCRRPVPTPDLAHRSSCQGAASRPFGDGERCVLQRATEVSALARGSNHTPADSHRGATALSGPGAEIVHPPKLIVPLQIDLAIDDRRYLFSRSATRARRRHPCRGRLMAAEARTWRLGRARSRPRGCRHERWRCPARWLARARRARRSGHAPRRAE